MSGSVVLLLRPGTGPEKVVAALAGLGAWSETVHGEHATSVVISAGSVPIDDGTLRGLPDVVDVLRTPSPHPRVDAHPESVSIAGVTFGWGRRPVAIAGPCSAENEAQVFRLAELAQIAGASFLRGGAQKPRTSPYSFSGVGPDGLRWLRRAADRFGLGLVSELCAARDAKAYGDHCDIIQLGARSMHHADVLEAAGKTTRPVLLKRAFNATMQEWLLAGERVLLAGAECVLFCERGVRGFDPTTRNVLDVGAIAQLAHIYRVPVLVDPSHAAGRRDLVAPLLRAGLAAGACGVLVEIHDRPETARSDGPQALLPSALKDLLAGV